MLKYCLPLEVINMNNNILYPEEFKEEVLSIFNNDENIKRLLDNNDSEIGFYLKSTLRKNIFDISNGFKCKSDDDITYTRTLMEQSTKLTKLINEWNSLTNSAGLNVREKTK